MGVTRKKKVVISILMAIAIILCGLWAAFCVYRINTITNVYDEIYYTIKGSIGSRNAWSYDRAYPLARWMTNTHMPVQMRWQEYNRFFLEEDNVYNPTTEAGESLACKIIVDTEELQITFTPERGDTFIRLVCTYSLQSKTLVLQPIEIYPYNADNGQIDDREFARAYLEENGITRDQLEEYYNYFLIEKLLADYFLRNGIASRFSIDNLGPHSIIDERYLIIDSELE